MTKKVIRYNPKIGDLVRIQIPSRIASRYELERNIATTSIRAFGDVWQVDRNSMEFTDDGHKWARIVSHKVPNTDMARGHRRNVFWIPKSWLRELPAAHIVALDKYALLRKISELHLRQPFFNKNKRKLKSWNIEPPSLEQVAKSLVPNVKKKKKTVAKAARKVR